MTDRFEDIKEEDKRQDFIGKAFDKLYLNQHRPWGYRLMRIAQQARNLLKKLR